MCLSDTPYCSHTREHFETIASLSLIEKEIEIQTARERKADRGGRLRVTEGRRKIEGDGQGERGQGV